MCWHSFMRALSNPGCDLPNTDPMAGIERSVSTQTHTASHEARRERLVARMAGQHTFGW